MSAGSVAPPSVRVHVESPAATARDRPSPRCTCWDIPFVAGEVASLVGVAGSTTVKVVSVVAAPYAGPAIALFTLLFVVTAVGHRRSRQNSQTAQRLVAKIEDANLQLTSIATKVGSAADKLTPLDKDWKKETAILLQTQAAQAKAQEELAKLYRDLQKENVNLKRSVAAVAKGAADAGVQAAQLSTAALAFDAALTTGSGAHSALDSQNTALAMHVTSASAGTAALARAVVAAGGLAQELKEPAGSHALQEAQAKAAAELAAKDEALASLQRKLTEKLAQIGTLESALRSELHSSATSSSPDPTERVRVREEQIAINKQIDEERLKRAEIQTRFEALQRQLADTGEALARSPRAISAATDGLDTVIVHAGHTVDALTGLTATTQAQIDALKRL